MNTNLKSFKEALIVKRALEQLKDNKSPELEEVRKETDELISMSWKAVLVDFLKALDEDATGQTVQDLGPVVHDQLNLTPFPEFPAPAGTEDNDAWLKALDGYVDTRLDKSNEAVVLRERLGMIGDQQVIALIKVSEQAAEEAFDHLLCCYIQAAEASVTGNAMETAKRIIYTHLA